MTIEQSFKLGLENIDIWLEKWYLFQTFEELNGVKCTHADAQRIIDYLRKFNISLCCSRADFLLIALHHFIHGAVHVDATLGSDVKDFGEYVC